jgi:TonB family protein
MRPPFLSTLVLATFLISSAAAPPGARAQTAPTANAAQGAQDAERILASFKARETECRRALTGYGFKRDAVIQSMGMGGQVTGEYHRVSYITFDQQGNMRERIISFPLPTLNLEPADLEDLNTIEIFGIEAFRIDSYRFDFVGRERVDELDTYVFEVSPKTMPDPKKSKERFFQGRIWIDDRDMQLVKAKGKGVPEGRQRFPTFEIYREQIDRYWFPSMTFADDKLVLSNGSVLRIRMRVRFSDFETPPTKEMIPNADLVVQPPTPRVNPAEPGPPSEPTPVTGAELNRKMIEKPKPSYPEKARRAGITGTVRVRLVIDEEGRVIRAEALEGPQELREAAVKAAMKARFTPTTMAGKPLKITGEISYDFNL